MGGCIPFFLESAPILFGFWFSMTDQVSFLIFILYGPIIPFFATMFFEFYCYDLFGTLSLQPHNKMFPIPFWKRGILDSALHFLVCYGHIYFIFVILMTIPFLILLN